MSDFNTCINWVLQFEDRGLTGRVVTLADGAGRTRFGIAEKFNPGLPIDFYTGPPTSALSEAKLIYLAHYWMPMHAAVLRTNDLAAELLSFAVNEGPHEAMKLFQGVLGFTGADVDGSVGPKTLAAMSAISDEIGTAARLRAAQAAHYRALGGQYLSDWLKRAETVFPALPS